MAGQPSPVRGGEGAYRELRTANSARRQSHHHRHPEGRMLFSSHEFIFLPIALIGYFALRAIAGKAVTLLWLAAASLAFTRRVEFKRR
jgi:hypothetical protein